MGSVEAARAVPLLVALCGTASEMPRESAASIAPGDAGHAAGPVADAAAAAATPLLDPPPASTVRVRARVRVRVRTLTLTLTLTLTRASGRRRA